ncbi:MAG: hypothetical protein ACREGR_03585, partial [Minisyncoccia bacterium]
MHLILPKSRPSVIDSEHVSSLPLFFLAGPILGADDWHREMFKLLCAEVGPCVVVNPSRYTSNHPDYELALRGPVLDESQTAWERYWLRQAATEWPTGCIIFWLPKESRRNPRADGNPYAIDTRGELGEWRGHLMHDPTVRIVIGAEAGFPGLSVIAKNFSAAAPDIRIHETMEEVAKRAVFYAQPRMSFSERVLA